MKVDFERSGGFTGISMKASLDTTSLPPQDAQELQGLIDRANFFNLPATIKSAPPAGADMFNYKITVNSGGKQHTVEVDDAGVPATLLPLIERLTTAARPGRP